MTLGQGLHAMLGQVLLVLGLNAILDKSTLGHGLRAVFDKQLKDEGCMHVTQVFARLLKHKF